MAGKAQAGIQTSVLWLQADKLRQRAAGLKQQVSGKLCQDTERQSEGEEELSFSLSTGYSFKVCFLSTNPPLGVPLCLKRADRKL